MGKSKKSKGFLKKKHSILYGIPHCHTENSTGTGDVKVALKYAKNKDLDFIIITDHNNALNNNKKRKDKNKWEDALKDIQKFNKKHDNFIGLLGFEFTLKPYGHLNIFASENFFSGDIGNIKNLLLWNSVNNPIMAINHPSKNIEKLDFNPLLNNNLSLIEVGNGLYPAKSYNRYEKRYYSLLDKGWKLGAINSQDNHKINFGDSDNLTAVLVEKKDKKNLLQSLRNRNTYSTESRTLKVHFYINGSLMGDVLSCKKNDTLKFSLYAEDREDKITKIKLISSKGVCIKEMDFPPQKDIKYFCSLPFKENEKWYVAKIFLQSGATALTSPIFLNEI